MLIMFSNGEGAIHTSDGVRIFYRAEGEGPITLLFVHGWGGNGSGPVWDPVLHRLSHGDLRLVSMDLRGHGRSEHTQLGFTTGRFAEDILEVADHLGAERFVVVGLQYERPMVAVAHLHQARPNFGSDFACSCCRCGHAVAARDGRRLDKPCKHSRELSRV